MKNRINSIVKLALVATGIVAFVAEVRAEKAKIYDLEHHCCIPEFYECLKARSKVANPAVPYMEDNGDMHVGVKTVIWIPDESIV